MGRRYQAIPGKGSLTADQRAHLEHRAKHEADCAAGRHVWVWSEPDRWGHCETCFHVSNDPTLADCPHQGERVAS